MKLTEEYLEYIVDESKGIVVCKVKPGYWGEKILEIINRITGSHDFSWAVHCNIFTEKRYPNKNQFVAVAKCSPEDTFNEQTGKRIARERLKKKLMRVIENGTNRMRCSLDNVEYACWKELHKGEDDDEWYWGEDW